MGRVPWRRAVATLLTGVLIGLVPFCHASPPDPSWIAGLYDNGDGDDAVLILVDAVGFEAAEGVDLRPPSVPRGRFVGLAPATPDTPSRIALVDRAPPLD